MGTRRPIAPWRPLLAIEFAIAPSRKRRIFVDHVCNAADKQIYVLVIRDIKVGGFSHRCHILCDLRQKASGRTIFRPDGCHWSKGDLTARRPFTSEQPAMND